jgi:hypothetical protein
VSEAGGVSFSRLRAVLAPRDSKLLDQLVTDHFDSSSGEFIDAFCECLPELSRDEVLWRFHFMLGTIYYTASGPHRIKTFSEGRCDPGERFGKHETPYSLPGGRVSCPGQPSRPTPKPPHAVCAWQKKSAARGRITR